MRGQKEGHPEVPMLLGATLTNYLRPPKPLETGSLEERQAQEQEREAARRALAGAVVWTLKYGNGFSEKTAAIETLLIAIENKMGVNPGI